MKNRFGETFRKNISLTCIFSLLISQGVLFSDPPEGDKPAETKTELAVPALPETAPTSLVTQPNPDELQKKFLGTALSDISLSPARLPATYEIFLVHMLKLSNIRLGLGESKKKVHLKEDKQLDIFYQMIALMQAAKDKKPYPEDKPIITSLEDYIRLKYPLQANSRNVEGDYDYYTYIFQSDVPVFYDIDPFNVDKKNKNPDWPFATRYVRSQAQAYEDARSRYMKEALKQTDKTLAGVLFLSVIGNIHKSLDKGVDYMNLITEAGMSGDIAGGVNFFRDLIHLGDEDEDDEEEEEAQLKSGHGLATGSAMAATVANGHLSRRQQKRLLAQQQQGGNNTTQNPPKPLILGANEKPFEKEEKTEEKNDSPIEPSRQMTSEDVSSAVDQVKKRSLRVMKRIKLLEDRFIDYVLAIGNSPKPTVKVDFIKFIQERVNAAVEKLGMLSNRIAESAQDLGLENNPDAKAYIDNWIFLAKNYIGGPDSREGVPGYVIKNIIWQVLTNEDLEANDLNTFTSMRNLFGPVIKKYDQIVGTWLGSSPLARTVKLQQSNGKKIPWVTALKIISSDPNQYNLRLRNYNYQEARGGTTLTFIPAEGRENPNDPWKPVGVKVKDPEFEPMLNFDEQFILKHAEKLAEMTPGVSADILVKALLDCVRNLRSESSDMSVVAEKHNNLGPKFEQSQFLRIGGTNFLTHFHVPRAWKAVKGSSVMVVDLIPEPKEIEDLTKDIDKKAVANATETLFYKTLLFTPIESFVKDGQPVEGYGNFDFHPGNVLVTDISDKRISDFPNLKIANIPQTSRVKSIDVFLPDWGSADSIEFSILKSIGLLAVGATTNNVSLISNSLWGLSTLGFREESESQFWRTANKDNREYLAFAGKQNLVTSKSNFRYRVWLKTWGLFLTHKTLSTEEWIKWAMQYIEFDEKLMAIKNGVETSKSLQNVGGNGYRKGEVLSKLSKTYGGDFLQLVRKDQGNLAYASVVADSVVYYMKAPIFCAARLIGLGKKKE